MSGVVLKSLNLRNCIKELHGHFIRTQKHTNSYFMSEIIKSYALCPSTLSKAYFAFLFLDEPTLPIWNFMIRGFSQSDQPEEALKLFGKMREQEFHGNNLTFLYILKASGRVSDVLMGKRVHALAIKLGYESYLYVGNALLYMYGLCGALEFAKKVFDEMPNRDLVSWNSLVCAYSQFNMFEKVLGLFHEMQRTYVKADAVTMLKVLLACSRLGYNEIIDSVTKYIKDQKVQIDVYLGNTLIDTYGQLGLIDLAQEVFDTMFEKNVITWNTLIMGYIKVGNLKAAKNLFQQMPKRDVISWTSIIVGHCQANLFLDAFINFQNMMTMNIKPDEFTIASVLSACARTGRLDFGMSVHKYVCQHEIKIDTHLANALIDMYCKCGSVNRALDVFHDMKIKDTVSWTSVITGLAVNGISEHALQLFDKMLTTQIRPTHGTYVGILLACAHGGLVQEGLNHFKNMERIHGLFPQMKHHGCIVDLYARAGYLEKAYEFIQNMHVVPDIVLWRILLCGCKLHGNVFLAEVVSRKLLELDPNNAGNYILSSNVYASIERWNDATRMRDLLNEDDMVKPLGWSIVELNSGT